MKKIVVLLPLLLLAGCSQGVVDPKGAVALVRDNADKAKKYHELMTAMKDRQVLVQAHVDGWKKECDARGLLLQMGSDGDPACSPSPTPAAAAAPQAAPSQGLSHIDGTMAPKK